MKMGTVEIVRRAIADTAEQYDMTLREFAWFLSRRHKSVRVDLLGGSVSSSAVDDELKTILHKEEPQMEFDTAKYTELAAQGMSNIDIFKEMEWDRSMTSFRDAAIRTGVYVRDPSGSQTKKARLTTAETELTETMAAENVAKAALVPDQTKKRGDDLHNRDSEEAFITIRIPITPGATYDEYIPRHVRESNIKNAVGRLRAIILSIHEDIAELLGEEDIERVQAYFDRAVGKAAKERDAN